MKEQWEELKETIIELRDNNGIGTQHEVCEFLANMMDILEKQMVWKSEIDKMPTVELIRCKDCKYWHCDDVDTYCYKLSIFDTDMNSYCSYAERKEEWVD